MKKCFMYIDDVVFVFRDIARQKPKSIYDHPFMAMLKKAHDLYGMKIQLNVFLRTDFFYGSDEFTLSDMPDCYKEEWTAASSWLKFGFHAKQEFPDYPYVNARYEDILLDFGYLIKETERFACKNNVARNSFMCFYQFTITAVCICIIIPIHIINIFRNRFYRF